MDENAIGPEPPDDDARRAANRLPRAFSSLGYRDFRLMWLGAVVSNIGSLMQTVAAQHLVYVLSHGSPVWLGIDAFATWVPMNLLLPFGGVLADRLDRRRVVIAGNVLLGLIAVVLGALFYFNKLTVLDLVIASAFSGGISGLLGPAIMTMMPQLVEPRDLPNAVSLNSMQFNISRALGPAAGGLAVALGATWCFGLNALSFLAVIIAAAMIHWRPNPAHQHHGGVLTGIRGGFLYFGSRPDLILAESLIVVMSFATSLLLTMLPAFVGIYGFTEKQSASALGVMMSLFGIGALAGATINAARERRTPSPWPAFAFLVMLGAVLTTLGLRPPFPVAAALTPVCGLFFMLSANRIFAAVLGSTPPALRGRMSSVHFLAFGVGLPVGSMIAGLVARSWGILAVFVLYGLGLIAAVAVMFQFLRSRNIQFRIDGHLEPADIAQAVQEGAA